MTKVSVVTISYNQAPYLQEALDSVLDQDGVEIEYIVVDPGSTDGSRDIIERYRPRLSHVIYERDKGPADGLNKGLALCTGELFYFLNSDDVVLPGALKAAADAFAAQPGIDVVYGSGRVIDERGRTVRQVIPPKMSTARYAYGCAFVLQQAAVIRTASLRAVGGFNIENHTSWDGEAFLDIARAGGRFRRIRAELGLFRIYPNSISGMGPSVQYLNDHLRLFEKPVGGRGKTGATSRRDARWRYGLRQLTLGASWRGSDSRRPEAGSLRA